MKYTNLILFTLILSISTITQTAKKDPEYGTFLTKYGFSVATGSGVGALAGIGCAKFEEKIFGPRASIFSKCIGFIIFNSISSSALKIASEGFDEHNITYNERALYSSQWLTSWIAYLMM